MKKTISILLALVLMVFAFGCTAAEPVAEPAPDATAPDAAEVATEAVEEAAEATGHPLAGKAVDENGEPLVLGYLSCDVMNDWTSTCQGISKTLWEAAGGEVICYVSNYDLALEVSYMNDLIELGVDAIIYQCSDSYAGAPAVEAAKQAGIPIITVDMDVEGADSDCYVHIDQPGMGMTCGQWIIDNYSAENPAKVLEIAGLVNHSAAVQRGGGFHEAVDSIDYIDVVNTVDTGWDPDVALNGILDAFQANPEINVIYSHSDSMMPGIIEGLRQIGKLVPVGEEGHIPVLSIDCNFTGIQAVRDGYVDMICEHSPQLHATICVNVALAAIYGQEIPADITITSPVVDATTVESPDRWANNVAGEFASWPYVQQDYFPIPTR